MIEHLFRDKTQSCHGPRPRRYQHFTTTTLSILIWLHSCPTKVPPMTRIQAYLRHSMGKVNLPERAAKRPDLLVFLLPCGKALPGHTTNIVLSASQVAIWTTPASQAAILPHVTTNNEH